MVYSSLEFLVIFLPLVLVGYWIIPKKYCNYWLLITSLYFYYLGAGRLLFLLLTVIAICYYGALVITHVRKKKLAMAVTVCTLITLLVFFKYINFLIQLINSAFNQSIESVKVISPLGLSFFIFQGISYVVDIYRGEICIKNPFDLALYISNFPQLVAGPIIRYNSIKSQLSTKNRVKHFDNLSAGLWRFSIGLSKKVLLANNMGELCDIIFHSEHVKLYSVSYAWLGAILYSLQLYFDFSGYSDMAIGLGKCFGFDYSENFKYPYMAGTITDFWRRWHISLSTWFRDYVYISLGGNRLSKAAWLRNMFVVWLLTGIWHGASLNFLVWGLGYFVILTIEKWVIKPEIRSKPFKALYRIVCLIIVVVLWVVFKTNSIGEAVTYLGAMFGAYKNSFIDSPFIFHTKNIALILIAGLLFSTNYPSKVYNNVLPNSKLKEIVLLIATILMTLISLGYIATDGYNPFLYFIF